MAFKCLRKAQTLVALPPHPVPPPSEEWGQLSLWSYSQDPFHCLPVSGPSPTSLVAETGTHPQGTAVARVSWGTGLNPDQDGTQGCSSALRGRLALLGAGLAKARPAGLKGVNFPGLQFPEGLASSAPRARSSAALHSGPRSLMERGGLAPQLQAQR